MTIKFGMNFFNISKEVNEKVDIETGKRKKKRKIHCDLIHMCQTIDEKVYEYHSKGGIIMILCLITGFLAKYFDLIAWDIGLIAGISVGACLLWDIVTALIFYLKCNNRKKKLVKQVTSEEDAFMYLLIIEKERDGEKVQAVLSDMFDGEEIVYGFSNLAYWEAVKNFFETPNVKAQEGELCYVPLSLGETVECLQKNDLNSVLIVHAVKDGQLNNDYSLTTLSELDGIVKENGDDFVPEWIMEMRKNKIT